MDYKLKDNLAGFVKP